MNKGIIQLTENSIDRILDKYVFEANLSDDSAGTLFKLQAKEFFYKFKASELYRVNFEDTLFNDISLLGIAIELSFSMSCLGNEFKTDIIEKIADRLEDNNFLFDLLTLFYFAKSQYNRIKSILNTINEGEKDNE